MTLPSDNPIRRSDDDVLGRTRTANSFAEHLLSLDISEGAVVGILGPWGSGKTSFINLARPALSEGSAAVLDFNPWMFSDAEQLTERFFFELSTQLRTRSGFHEIGERLSRYGEVLTGMGWVPIVGPWADRARLFLQALKAVVARRNGGLAERRASIEVALFELDKPLIVILDDIDRLTSAEIRDIFKLVRLTASFPNVIYIVAFDRSRIESALQDEGIPGRDYLEKILQVSIDLPEISDEVFDQEIFRELDAAIASIENPGQIDEDRWPDVFVEIIRPLLRNLRDLRRYAGTASWTVRDLDGQINLTDVLGLEALRLFMPDVFRQLGASVTALTTDSDMGYRKRTEDEEHKRQIDALVEVASEHSELLRSVVKRLFPAAERYIDQMEYGSDWERRWLRERRVAHKDILRLYLERIAGRDLLAFSAAEEARSLMTDFDALERHLRSLSPEAMRQVISSLEKFEDDFSQEEVVPSCVVLLNLLPHIPEKQEGLFDFGKRMVVVRVVLRLLRSLKGQEAVQSAVQEIVPQLTRLTAKMELIKLVGYRENTGHKLVSEEAAAKFEADWREEVRSADAEALAGEEELLMVLYLVREESGSDEPELEIPDTPEVTLALLESGLRYSVSQGMESRAVRRSARLAWDILVEVCGDEASLRHRFESLKASALDVDDELLELTEKYLDGWRPEDFGDD